MSDIQQVEIKGVKYEVDFSSAKKIETYKVGNKVKVLLKQYGDEYKIAYGMITDIVAFDNLPTIQVMYIENGYNSVDFKIASFNEKTKSDIEIAPLSDSEVMLDKNHILDNFDKKISSLTNEIEDIQMKKKYFVEKFSKCFEVDPVS